jgi:hypothetical protein
VAYVTGAKGRCLVCVRHRRVHHGRMTAIFDRPTLFSMAPSPTGIATGVVPGDLQKAAEGVVGETILRPPGPLAGHNTGTPIETLLADRLTGVFGPRVRRHYEVLNAILDNRPDVTSGPKRKSLFGRPSTQSLLCSGRNMAKWRPGTPFVEAQGDTADFILFDNEYCALEPAHYMLIDAKSVNLGHEGQPPNIISAAKLFDAMVDSVDEGAVACDLVYLALGYIPRAGTLEVEQARVLSLFKVDQLPYINWTASNQIQFDPFKVDQDFSGSALDWANRFVEYYCDQRALKIAKDKKKLRDDRARVQEARTRPEWRL